MDYLYLLITCALSIELFFRLSLISYVNLIFRNINRVFLVILSSKISVHWKEKVVPAYAVLLLKYSLSILGIFFLIILLISLFTAISNDFIHFLLSLKGILISIITSILYLKLRKYLHE